MMPQQETITKAVQCSDLLTSNIRDAHKVACEENPVLEIVLRDLIADAARISRRLAEIKGCLR